MENPLRIIWYNVRNLMLLCMLIFSLVVSYDFGLSAFIQILIGFFIALILDFCINYLRFKSKEFPASGVISGLIVANLFSQGSYLIVGIATALAILSKQFIKYKGRHIFNPATFGIAAIGVSGFLIAINATVTWLPGFADLAFIRAPGLLIILGFVILYRLKRWEIHLTYFATTAVLLLIKGFAVHYQPDRIIEFVYQGITEPAILFFVFFMVVEPITSPTNRKGRIIYSFIIATASFAFNLTNLLEYAPLFALIIGNALVLFIDNLTKKKIVTSEVSNQGGTAD